MSEDDDRRDPTSERELIARARGGDGQAYAALVRRHQGVALRVAAVIGPATDAEDACQEAFVKAYRALDRFDPDKPFRAWLLAIVANEARTRGREGRRIARLVERAASIRPASSSPSGEELAERSVHLDLTTYGG
ncbi:MAG: sigma-70 family RNA polymerase sigma factor [Gaiellales bacterium]